MFAKGDALVACSLGILSGYDCDTLGPTTLADSEVLSHDAGLLILNLAVDRLDGGVDPDAPDMVCTWEPLDDTTRLAPEPPLPATFLGRVGLLVERFVHGVMP